MLRRCGPSRTHRRRTMLTLLGTSISIGAREFALRTPGSAAPLVYEKEIHFPVLLLQSASHNCSSCLHGRRLLVRDWNGPGFPSSERAGECFSKNAGIRRSLLASSHLAKRTQGFQAMTRCRDVSGAN